MSIPGISIKAVRGNRIMMRDQVGGNIRGTVPGFFELYTTVMSVSGNNHVQFLSPPMCGVRWELAGVTKDSTGAVLGGCEVDLFYSNDIFVSEVLSDPTTGVFKFLISPSAGPFYFVAYKPGAPDVAGTTVNTLMPVVT
jgi:hypothetical protein